MKSNNLRIVSPIVMLVVCILAVLSLTGGCTSMLHDVAIAKYPLLHTSITQASPPKPEYARIVVYAPRAPLAGVNLVGVGGMATLPITIKGQNDICHANIFDQTGFYMDVPPGDYQITGGDTKKCINETFAASQIYVIKAEANMFILTSKTPALSDNFEDAVQEIKKNKIRYCLSGATDPLMLQPTLIPNVDAASVWLPSPLPQTRPNSIARIYILNRTFIVGGAARPSVGVDCLPDIEIDKTKYICFEVTPGRHIFSVKLGYFGTENLMAPMGYVIDLKENEDLFMDFDPNKGFGFVSQEEAQKLIQNQDKMAKGGYYCLRSTIKPLDK